jgi:hypothetical protein
MAIFNPKTFVSNDNYMTPKYAWENIKHLIPKDKIIWEPFYGDGKSGIYLTELGFNVIHEPIDFFENDLGEIILSNPPYSKIKEIIKRLMVLDKPFILLLPCSRITTSYFRDWKDKGLQIIIPKKRIHFERKILVNGEKDNNVFKNSCNYD